MEIQKFLLLFLLLIGVLLLIGEYFCSSQRKEIIYTVNKSGFSDADKSNRATQKILKTTTATTRVPRKIARHQKPASKKLNL